MSNIYIDLYNISLLILLASVYILESANCIVHLTLIKWDELFRVSSSIMH